MATSQNNIKNLNKQYEKNIEAFDSYYKSMGGLADSFLGKTKEVKESLIEVNELISLQIEQNKSLSERVDKLSKYYSVSNEEMKKALTSLDKYRRLQEQLATAKAGNMFSGYTNNLEQQIKALEKNQTIVGILVNEYKNHNPELEEYVTLSKEANETTKELNESQEKYNEALEKNIKSWEKFKNGNFVKFLGALKDGIVSLGKVGYEKFKEVDQAGHDFGRNMGMSTDELKKHTSSLYKTYGGLAKKLGMEFKDMYKFQISYADATQKAAMLTSNQVGTMAALSRNTGEEAVSVASKNLDVFASSADATIEYLAKGTARASLEGLNIKQYSEAFANNIKMASKYTFKEGITGIQKMTLLSQRLKFNMESIGSAMDKFSTIEGAIEASSKIQVLGGAFASNFGNPLEVMSQALLNGEGFTKRIIDTVSSQARFNSKTGEVDLSPIDKQRLKAYADALGISYDEIHNMATQTRKGKEISRVVGNNFSEDEIAYLSNKSQYNKEKGVWELIDAEGIAHDITKMSKGELDSIRKTDSQEKILNSNVSDIKKHVQDIASNQTSFNENVTKITESTAIGIGGIIDGLDGFAKTLMTWVSALGGLGVTGAIAGIGGALFSGARGMFGSSSIGGLIGGSKGRSSGGSFSRGRQMVLGRQATNKVTKFIKGKGGILAVIGGGLGVYNAMSNYSDEEQAILNSNMTASEKETAIAKAKVERNKGVGGSVGGAAGGWLGALGGAKAGGMAGAAIGSMFGGVGAVPGAFIGSILGGLAGGFGGGYLGNSIGESIGEAVSDEVKEKQGSNPNEIKVEDIKVNVNGSVKLVADGTNGSIDIRSLIENKSFRDGIGDIVKEHIKNTVGGRTV